MQKSARKKEEAQIATLASQECSIEITEQEIEALAAYFHEEVFTPDITPEQQQAMCNDFLNRIKNISYYT